MNIKFDGDGWKLISLTGVDVNRHRPFVVHVYGEGEGREFEVIIDEDEQGPLYGALNSAIQARMADCR